MLRGAASGWTMIARLRWRGKVGCHMGLWRDFGLAALLGDGAVESHVSQNYASMGHPAAKVAAEVEAPAGRADLRG